MQGTSLAPAFNGKDIGRKAPIYWEHEGTRAMREGKWKLVAKGANGPWELYDIEADRTELNNLAQKESTRLEDMAARWEKWAVEALAKPWPWGAKKKAKGAYNAALRELGKGPPGPAVHQQADTVHQAEVAASCHVAGLEGHFDPQSFQGASANQVFSWVVTEQCQVARTATGRDTRQYRGR